jgi:uncharacterized protein (DUF111 family)
VPNILRAVWGCPPEGDAQPPGLDAEGREEVLLLQSVVDDASGELLGSVTEALRAAEALDVWLTPLIMKKGRPGVEISVLARPESQAPLLDLLFTETGTLGVRVLPVSRWVLEREWLSVRVKEVPVRVKVGRRRGVVVTVAPEHAEAAAAAGRLGLPLREVYRLAGEAARRALAAGQDADGTRETP